MPIVVDEVWGAHFAFHEALPQDALSAGADLVISSTHKMLGSLTQSAMLHLGRDSLLDEEDSLRELLVGTGVTRRLDLGGGVSAVREYDTVWLERSPTALDREVAWGGWRISADEKGLKVRGWRPGDRLAGRARKVQDVLVDAKVPRQERDAWPLVATEEGAVVAVAGLAEAPGWEGAVTAVRQAP